MKKFIIQVIPALLLLFSVHSFACVGRTLIIGAVDSANDRLLAQMMAVIINERTGSTVNVTYFDNHQKLFEAVRKRKIDLFTENSNRALKILEEKAGTDESLMYSTVKEGYKDQFHLTLLKPFGRSPREDKTPSSIDVPVIVSVILIDYPALPRVINKLAGIENDKKYARLFARVASGDKPTQAARDFLKKKRFI